MLHNNFTFFSRTYETYRTCNYHSCGGRNKVATYKSRNRHVSLHFNCLTRWKNGNEFSVTTVWWGRGVQQKWVGEMGMGGRPEMCVVLEPLPNQQRTLINSKLPTELQCRNFVKKHRLSMQIGTKRAETCMKCVIYSN